MITNYKLFKESLSSDRKSNMQMELLIKTCREMISNYDKADEFEQLKKNKNVEVQALLDKMNATSIIAKGVLIEVVKPYESNRLATKEYMEFVMTSKDAIDEEYVKMHAKAIELATKFADESSYLRFNKNSKNLATGTLVPENFVSNAFKWAFNKFKNLITKFLAAFDSKLQQIAQQAKQFQTTLITTEAVTYYCKDCGNSTRDENSKCKECGSSNWQTEQTVFESNATAPDLTEILTKAKEAIELAEQEAYYKNLARINEEHVKMMLSQFKAKAIAIDNILVSKTIISAKEKLSEVDYMNAITNAEIVGESVADMANSLLSLYTKSFQVSGSVRQYADDTNSPDGVLNATFDYVFKKVMLSQDNPNHQVNQVNQEEKVHENKLTDAIASVVNTVFNKIKQFISMFKISNRKCDLALAELNKIQIN